MMIILRSKAQTEECPQRSVGRADATVCCSRPHELMNDYMFVQTMCYLLVATVVIVDDTLSSSYTLVALLSYISDDDDDLYVYVFNAFFFVELLLRYAIKLSLINSNVFKVKLLIILIRLSFRKKPNKTHQTKNSIRNASDTHQSTSDAHTCVDYQSN